MAGPVAPSNVDPEPTGVTDAYTLLARLSPWWQEYAECRVRGLSPDEMTVKRGQSPRPLRAVCAACPVKGHCLKDGLSMALMEQLVSPMRCGLSGSRAWRRARAVVAELEPTSDSEWLVVADLVLAELPLPSRRRPAA